ncbi:hypothetical protein CfE428DRAFT_1110 [Chthoniobacter flavus Ellin428]|uniref:3-keto-disaccharide hydrolase domain-containing protein n=1 Tax=Chthoniobacter flavus Ellin428 TaxID=497964 RepID=B4CWS2_9BACT|nr:hypothetical protein [Chthoniobacter flavus]EDY21864.1 hypothetical protein CfE428DRAFT_1110 [Chthoniobacter flavus Ellin428]TCO95788.1 hypothetical protein EV701_101479 [Chthoniobacter flavus]
MLRSLPFLLSAVLCATTAFAADPAPLVDETFSSPTLPPKWQPGGRPNCFSIVDGALRGVAQPDDAHGPSIGVPIEGHNLAVQFRVKFAQPGYFLFLINGDSQFGGQAHLLRFALAKDMMQLAQDRGALASKQEQKVARDAAQKAGMKVPPPTQEQLADPKFYRTESLARQPAKPTDGEWHKVSIELRGNEVVAKVDDLPAMHGTGSVLDVKKSRLVFLVGNSGDVRIDDVKASEIPAKP